MKIGVKVMPRNEVLDTQGRAVERTLKTHGKNLQSCRVGKYIIIDVNENDKDNTLDAVMIKTIREQAQKKNYSFNK